ncbi:putative beta-lysine N-acetyltransferase [Hazenella sp. IB182357]|uniref:Beta-lysine N-acetyltransferase n=1 Tax=Polycladospora coralii TaxID=2771432 RepID=A0A926NBX4_9BACL|nr:putative beta-lysine N-acetyltransferase [Polycladospora coralii]MBD1372545.1 putative beta-lysine N-acetyltransferase [Polycladospora coralii]MBS7531332.1 putative beta-lysine N-acetyltransferase [Polycladospora coralii]
MPLNKQMGVWNLHMMTKQVVPTSVSYELDEYNSRIKLIQYSKDSIESLVDHLEQLANDNDLSKVMIYADPEDISIFEKLGFELEGEISGFFDGDPACVLSRFLNNGRSIQKDEAKKDEIVEMAENADTLSEPPALEPGYAMRCATMDDAEALARIYDQVFKTYPTPMHDPAYVKKCMENDVYFTVVTYNGEVISTASADIFTNYNSAEITDCATLPEHRGKGLLSCIIFDLEQRMREKGVPNLFSLTRAVSTGMNMVISKLGFEYKGRLIQNSQIGGTFEDMNIWIKNIK